MNGRNEGTVHKQGRPKKGADGRVKGVNACDGCVTGVTGLSAVAPHAREGEPTNTSHPSRLPADIGAELDERISIRLADATRRRAQRADLRRQLASVRDAGLRARHHTKQQHLHDREEPTPMASRRGDTFGKWLLARTARSGPIGDLARDYAAPCDCPTCAGRASRRYSVAGVREELRRHSAKPAMFEALDLAEAEWRLAEAIA